MTDLKLLTHLRHQGIRIWVEKDRLHYQTAKNALTLVLRTQIAETGDLNNQSRQLL